VHACNPSTREVETGGLQFWGQLGPSEFKASLVYIVRPCLETNKQKASLGFSNYGARTSSISILREIVRSAVFSLTPHVLKHNLHINRAFGWFPGTGVFEKQRYESSMPTRGHYFYPNRTSSSSLCHLPENVCTKSKVVSVS
jgi:hypothetical protein